MGASFFEATQFIPHFTHALDHQATLLINHSVPHVDPPTGSECTQQWTGRSSLLQSPASPYKLMNWHLIWNISLMSLVNVCLFRRDDAAFRTNNCGFWANVWTQNGDKFTTITNATLGISNLAAIFKISFIFLKTFFCPVRHFICIIYYIPGRTIPGFSLLCVFVLFLCDLWCQLMLSV